MQPDWRYAQGRPVVVTAEGLIHRGTVWELGEQTLVLKSPGGYQEIPWERITRIEEASPEPDTPAAGNPLPPGWE